MPVPVLSYTGSTMSDLPYLCKDTEVWKKLEPRVRQLHVCLALLPTL